MLISIVFRANDRMKKNIFVCCYIIFPYYMHVYCVVYIVYNISCFFEFIYKKKTSNEAIKKAFNIYYDIGIK